MADELPQINFNDGEGVDHLDFNRLQSLLTAKTIQRAANMGRLGGAMAMGNATGLGAFAGGGAELGQVDSNPALSVSDLFLPSPLAFVNSAFEVSAGGTLGIDYGSQHFVQAVGGSTPGTAPDGFDGPLSYAGAQDEIAVSSARPTTNNRYDSLGIRLGHSVGGPEVRGFEDAVTRALSSPTPNKDQNVSFEYELIEGVEAASPAIPVHTAGFAKLLTVLRYTGETSLLLPSVQLHAFPTRLRTETVWARDFGHDPAAWTSGGQGNMGLTKNGTGAGSLLVCPKTMHSGCRLVGIAIGCGTQTNNYAVNLGSYTLTGSASSILELLGGDIGSGNAISTGAQDFCFAGLADFDRPIWGNGKSYGPLLGGHATSPAEGLIDQSLYCEIGSGDSITSGDSFHYVKFYYLE